ncbi:MAG: hypothetical protein KGJ23_04540 [Euryarchaeota archaeon]|nr:hypothetical protein [Euryarchaeota archaeon]MDE1835867.1 hypothetical protein [Euryarchaeota archaeon]MDE1882203.1 hypothetical protein [Euryarchaeota archaeon]MDE2044455.1 hypothetical protein [Thermoplasmata archaeon]
MLLAPEGPDDEVVVSRENLGKLVEEIDCPRSDLQKEQEARANEGAARETSQLALERLAQEVPDASQEITALGEFSREMMRVLNG